jgi:hypothetical protein
MALVALALVTACGFNSPSGNQNGSGGMIDARVDAPPDAQQCFGSFVKVCFTTSVDIPTAPVPLNDVNLDTGDLNMCNQRNDQAGTYCVVAGAGLVLDAGKTLRAYGNKPLVLLSTTTFQLQGTIDVASYRTPVPANGLASGAGANPLTLCTGGAGAQGAGGGFGGSFGGKGGNGEQVDVSAGGTAAGIAASPTSLRGGCPGGDGALVASIGGAGGSGGGAVAVIAPTIMLDGRIDASGAGGRGGAIAKAGAGGGGSGGMIVLDAMTIMGNGMLYANGGSGAQGGAGGADGAESTAPASFAAGGKNTPATDGGQGGDGSAIPKANGGSGNNSQNQGGGGGGGGGAGIVRAAGVTTNISPPSSM